MSLQTLAPPQDITWTRMAYSRDMIDTNFGDVKFPPKWRSSLAVYYYIVPDEETADAYPNSRIVYLRLTCSVTGWNPNEELRNARTILQNAGALDDLQSSVWNAVAASGWASAYWPCLGAIMQIAVYPPRDQNVGPDDFPEIMDFEPKKREMYEAVTEGNESMSGSSDKLSITKGTTKTKSAEASGGFSVGGFGIGGSAGYSKTTVDSNTTDTSREARETASRTTSFSQMYQLFNGYHLGTNRASFVVAPRPHTASGAGQTEFNLIDGERKLEGIQDVFLIVSMPRTLNGFCIQATLDTGHTVMESNNNVMMMKDNSIDLDDDGPPLPPPDDDPPPPGAIVRSLIVTRRIIQNCGRFDDNGNFILVGVPERPRRPDIHVVGEHLVHELTTRKLLMRSVVTDVTNKRSKVELANNMNSSHRRVIKSMIGGFTADNYEPRAFTESFTFRRLVKQTLETVNFPLDLLVKFKYITREEADALSKNRIFTATEIFKASKDRVKDVDLKNVKSKILNRALYPER